MRRKRHPIHRFVLLVVSRPRATMAVTLLVAAVCVGLAVWRLRISTDQNKLFSTDVPFFRAFVEFDRNFPQSEEVFVVIRATGDEKAVPVVRWAGAADAVAANLNKLPQHVKLAVARVAPEELGEQGLLFERPGRLRATVEEVREFGQLAKLVGEPPDPVTGLLVGGGPPLDRLLAGMRRLAPAQTGEFAGAIARSVTASVSGDRVVLPDLNSIGATNPERLGYFWVPDESDKSRHLLLVRVQPKHEYSSLTAISDTVDAIRGAVNEAAKAYPELTFGVTGRPALAADEMRTTDRDSHRAEAVALTAVFVGLVVLFRSLWLAFAAELALGVGIAWTFGWATLTLGELNLLSIVFLLALIGIGMDYLVQILSRYRAEVARRSDARRIWVSVFRQVGPPINTACLGAAGAFLVSMLTDFQGAADLGLIAGGGLVLCLLAGYTFLPAVLTVWPGRVRGGARSQETRISRGTRRWWVGPVVWLAALVVAGVFARRTGFNPSLLELQAQNLESVQLVRRLETWSAVVLSKDLEALRAARAAVAGSAGVERTESVLSAYDNYEALTTEIPPLPAIKWTTPGAFPAGAVTGLANRAEALAGRMGAEQQSAATALREMSGALKGRDAAAVAGRLTAWQAGFVELLKGTLRQFSPPPPDLAKAPRVLRDYFQGTDGTYALYVYPKGDLWDQAELVKFVEDVERRVGAVPGVTLTGIAHNIYHSTASIRSAFYRSTFYALGLILVLVWIDLRSVRHTLLAVGVLALGLPMLVGLMGWLGVDWNFANFFGLPILIGAGHEYGVFMVHRYRESLRDPRRGWPGWDVADSALLLCAFVTSSSFGFFYLLANHQGLKSLGLVMALGTVCIYAATVVAVRPVLRWRLGRRGEVDATRPPSPEADGGGRSPLGSIGRGRGRG
jgi:hypothetical protein